MVAAVVITVVMAIVAVAVFVVVDAMATKEKREKYGLKRGQGRE